MGALNIFLECPRCRSSRFDVPESPRGDSACQCIVCGEWYTYAELEREATQKVRAALSSTFPHLVVA
jgi:hypothetical protein